MLTRRRFLRTTGIAAVGARVVVADGLGVRHRRFRQALDDVNRYRDGVTTIAADLPEVMVRLAFRSSRPDDPGSAFTLRPSVTVGGLEVSEHAVPMPAHHSPSQRSRDQPGQDEQDEVHRVIS